MALRSEEVPRSDGDELVGKFAFHPLDSCAAFEIIAVASLIAATIWVAPLLSRLPVTTRDISYAFAGAIGLAVVGSEIFHHDRLTDVGLRIDNFWQAIGLLALPTAGLSLVLVMLGASLNSLHFSKHAFATIHLEWYSWMLIQQYLLQGFLNRRLQDVCGKGWESVLLTAALFAAFHLPNPALMVATLCAGILWARVYQRIPNLFALALSHLVLSFVLSHSLPLSILPNARVGWAFHW